MKKHLDILYSK